MLEVSINLNGEHEVGVVEIKLETEHPDGTADYMVLFHVDRLGAVGHHRRFVYGFPRTKFNSLALLRMAMETLTEWELSLEDGTNASDLARGQHRPRGTLSLEA